MVSQNRAFTLTVQSDGNVVERRGPTAVWTTRTTGNPGAVLDVQTDGNLVVRASSGRALWTSGTPGHRGASLLLDDDGLLELTAAGTYWSNGVGQQQPPPTRRSTLTAGQSIRSDAADPNLYSPTGRIAFQPVSGGVSASELTTSMSSSLWHRDDGRGGGQGLPGVLTMQTDGNLVLRGTNRVAYWATGSRGAGNRFVVQDDGNFVVRRPNGSAAWASGTTRLLLLAGETAASGTRFVAQYNAWEPRIVTTVQPDGNVVTRNAQNQAVWQTGTSGNPGARLTVQTDGNMIVRRPDGRAVWQTGTSRCGAGGVYNVGFGVLYARASTTRAWTTFEGNLGAC